MPSLYSKFSKALQEKQALFEHQKKELQALERLAARSKNLPIEWNVSVTSKNAFKTIQMVQILLAFKKRRDDIKAYETLTDVRMTTNQLWKYTQLPSISTSKGPSTNFRGYLNSLKGDFLYFDQHTAKWSLTDKALWAINGGDNA